MGFAILKIIGDKRISKRLAALTKKDRRKAIRKGARAGAKLIQKQAKKNAPKATGELRKSIKVRSLKRSRRWSGSRVVSAVRHTWPVESGTEKVEGKKYMGRAQTTKRKQATEVFKQTILDEIHKIWRA